MPRPVSDPAITTVSPSQGEFSVCSDANIVGHVYLQGEAGKTILLSMYPGEYSVDAMGFATLKVLAGTVQVRLEARRVIEIEGGGELDLSEYQPLRRPLLITSSSFAHALLHDVDRAGRNFEHLARVNPVPPRPRCPVIRIIRPE